MKIYTNDEVNGMLDCNLPGSSLEYDNHGQMIIYTGLFRWLDGSIRDVEDPEYDDDPTDA
jgi:hypothetical protein